MKKTIQDKLDAMDELAKACAADSSKKKTLWCDPQPEFLAGAIKTQEEADRFMDQLEAFTLLAQKRC
jgi:hypothetical protein